MPYQPTRMRTAEPTQCVERPGSSTTAPPDPTARRARGSQRRVLNAETSTGSQPTPSRANLRVHFPVRSHEAASFALHSRIRSPPRTSRPVSPHLRILRTTLRVATGVGALLGTGSLLLCGLPCAPSWTHRRGPRSAHREAARRPRPRRDNLSLASRASVERRGLAPAHGAHAARGASPGRCRED